MDFGRLVALGAATTEATNITGMRLALEGRSALDFGELAGLGAATAEAKEDYCLQSK